MLVDPRTVPDSLPPPGLNFISAIEQGLIYLLISTVFSSILLPLLIGLFVFSTPPTRRTPIFILNVIAHFVGILVGFSNGVCTARSIVSPLQPCPGAVDAFTGVFMMLGPTLADCILLLRVVAVYPRSATRPLKFIAILAFPVCAKIVRVAAEAVCWYKLIITTNAVGSEKAAIQIYKTPYARVEWFLQTFDNMYVSALFIHRIYTRSREQAIVNPRGRRSRSLAFRIKTALYIAIGNFIFPVLFNVAMIISVYRDSDFTLHATSLMIANTYVAVIGVAFATLWSAHANSSGKYETQATMPTTMNSDSTDVETHGQDVIVIGEHHGELQAMGPEPEKTRFPLLSIRG